jgi:hypothetical protein
MTANAFATLYNHGEEEDEGGYNRRISRGPLVIYDRSAGPRFLISRPEHIIATGFHEEDDDPNLTLADGIAMCIYHFEIATGKTGIMDCSLVEGASPSLPGGSNCSGTGGWVSY